MKILINDINTKEGRTHFDQLHASPNFIGGSDIASICGVGWESPLEVWLRKTGKQPPSMVTEQMKLGLFMEDFILQMLKERTDINITKLSETWQSKQNPWMIYTPDAKADNYLIECKTHKNYADKYWSDTKASDSATCQLQWGMEIGNFEEGYCVALIGGDCNKFYYPKFTKNRDIIDQLIARANEFREFIIKDIPPNAGPGDSQRIKEYLVPHLEEREIDLSLECSSLMERFKKLQEEAKQLKEPLEEIEDEMIAIKNQILQRGKGASNIKIGENLVKISHIITNEHVIKAYDYYKITVK